MSAKLNQTIGSDKSLIEFALEQQSIPILDELASRQDQMNVIVEKIIKYCQPLALEEKKAEKNPAEFYKEILQRFPQIWEGACW